MSANFYEAGGKNAAVLSVAANVALCVIVGAEHVVNPPDQSEPPEIALQRQPVAEQLVAFGLRQNLPPAEAFARESARLGLPFSKTEWDNDPLFRAGWEAFRAVVAALAEIDLGLDPKPEPEPKRAQPRPAPGDFAHERESRERIAPPAKIDTHPGEGSEGGTPLSAVKGIGEKLEARLMAIGVLTVEQFVSERATDQFEERLKRDPGLVPLLSRNRIFEKASAHLSA